MSETRKRLAPYDCCDGVRGLTPVAHENRPGLSALAYRVGTHGSFKATMLARISTMPSLGVLATRDDNDLTIALIDAWSTVADVLSFYAERIANEGFMRSAMELRSIQELARSIGYEPQPGVAASTHLAFTVEDAPEAAREVPIPVGTRAQSSPEGDELPQTFETTQELRAHPEWNALRPRPTVAQLFDQGSRVFYFQGTDTRLAAGDWMLLRAGENSEPENPGAIANIPLQVVRVEPDEEKQHTRIELAQPQIPEPGIGGPPILGLAEAAPPPPPDVFTEPLSLSGANAATLATDFAWSANDAVLFELMHSATEGFFAKYKNKTAAPELADEIAVFAMRVASAPFGHNAPRWDTLPREWRIDPPDTHSAPFPNNWDQTNPPWPINVTSRGLQESYGELYGDPDQEGEIILLDAIFSQVLPGSLVLLTGSGHNQARATFRVTKSEQVARADFALSAQVTALTLEPDGGEMDVSQFHLRTTSIHAQSEALALAGKPIEEAVQSDAIELDHMLENQIFPGQAIIVSGTPTSLQGIVESELVIVKDAVHSAGYTKLVFESKLQRAYRRDSVRLNANVVPATHGQSQTEVLGAGDASQAFQSFPLSHAPLTYVSAPVPSGAQSALELRVNEVRWHEAANLFGLRPEDRRYVLRRDEAGKSTVAFGDGRSGGRLPTGFENVVAHYRTGLGVAGNLPPDRITLLGSQPRYVQSVTNPVPAAGGADPESSSDTRRNAPNSVRTFGRIVSLRDFEDFARAFAGISKARATLLQVSGTRIVHVTIAGENGALVPIESALYRDLVEAMSRVRDPVQRLVVTSYEKRFFDVAANVRVHADNQSESVFRTIEETLHETFSFDRRELAQSITRSEVIATIQGVRGVEAIDLDRLRFSHERLQVAKSSFATHRRRATKQSRLPARRARLDGMGTILAAQHLRIHRIQLEQMS